MISKMQTQSWYFNPYCVTNAIKMTLVRREFNMTGSDSLVRFFWNPVLLNVLEKIAENKQRL